ncbi:MAG: energy-coupling factor transporter transmembrane protein EcfT [Ruminiclostridium sp.]|nr:energy-coupling factor transporter transmembrane protein EcfT [Ruminiclostridium sp.]
MIKDITLGQYIPGDSVLHKADPRTKIILAFVYMIALFMIKTNAVPIIKVYAGFAAVTFFTFLAIVVSGIPLKYTLKGLKPILVIIVFTMLINIFTTNGTPVYPTGLLSKITVEGINTAIIMALRLALLIIGVSLLTLTTTPILLTDGIEKLLQPFKKMGLPAHELAMMMTIALRFIPTLLEETDKIMKAQSARGADFDTGNLIQRAKSFIPVLVPLFVSAFRRADELATAMEARCYRGSMGRTRMRQLKLGGNDAVIASVTCMFFACLLLLQYAI